MEMEPRMAGDEPAEPAVEFEREWDDLHDRAECPPTRHGITIPGC
jgi:hypothetical protein